MLAIGITLWHYDPSQTGWMPKCIFKLTTGYDCPSCGATRASHALLHGHFAEALRYNYFAVISIIYALLAGIVYFFPKMHNTKLRLIVYGKTVGLIYVGLFFAWWILRNIPSIKELL